MTTENHGQRILIVEDDATLASMVQDYLAMQGFEVSIEPRGDNAIVRIPEEQPDAVLLDINLPGKDGFEVCRSVRHDYKGAIIMLTARGDEIDEVVGLEIGADDYMAKPVRPRALLARLHAHLRRSGHDGPNSHSDSIVVGGLQLFPSRRVVTLHDQPIDLTTAEFELLKLLAENAGQSLSRTDIFQRVHGIRYDGQDRSIDLRISRLRKKLGDDPVKPLRVKSVRGVGYMLAIEP